MAATPPVPTPSASAAVRLPAGAEDPPCPAGDATPSDGSPSFLLADIGDLFPILAGDFLDAYGEQGPVQALSAVQQRQAVCAAFGSGAVDVLGRAVSQKPFRISGPERCPKIVGSELHLGRFIYDVARVPNGNYVVTRTARAGSPLYQGHSIRTRVEGAFVVTTSLSQAWRCPIDAHDPCEAHETDGGATEARCFDEKTRCSDAGYWSEVYVIDWTTRAQVMFGGFDRLPEPKVTISEKGIVVTAGSDCTQRVALPLVAGNPEAPGSRPQ